MLIAVPMSERLQPKRHGGRHFDVLIVGAGHAGAQTAIALRQGKFEGTIALLGDEPDLPYERPPLSKDYLAGNKSLERLLIRPAAFWAERAVSLLPGERIVAIDASNHTVTTNDGASISYGALVWATGGAARRLTCHGSDLLGVHTLRNRADADRMRAELLGTTRAVVIGGGYIGLEAAAVLVKTGKHVTILEAQDRVLARVAAEPLSRFYEAEHRARGVDIRLDVQVGSIEGHDGRVSGVRLHDGRVFPADMVIVGIGIVPAVEPLLAAGATGGNGVMVDGQCRTSLPDVYAIGDCALHANQFANGAKIRLESIQNANDQATIAAKNILGIPATYDAVPWFWSNQYDLKLQTVGLSTGFDDAIVRGIIAERRFSIVYLKSGYVIALDCVNSMKDYAQGKKLVLNKSIFCAQVLADTSVSLLELSNTEQLGAGAGADLGSGPIDVSVAV